MINFSGQNVKANLKPQPLLNATLENIIVILKAFLKETTAF